MTIDFPNDLITGNPNSLIRKRKKKGHDGTVNRFLNDLGIEIKERRFKFGLIRYRKKINANQIENIDQDSLSSFKEKSPSSINSWKVNLYGNATKLREVLNKN